MRYRVRAGQLGELTSLRYVALAAAVGHSLRVAIVDDKSRAITITSRSFAYFLRNYLWLQGHAARVVRVRSRKS